MDPTQTYSITMMLGTLGAAILAGMHLASPVLHAVDRLPRARLLSFASGITVAFVVVRLLPALADGQALIEPYVAGSRLEWMETPVYLLTLIGVLMFYGLEKLVQTSRFRRRVEIGHDCTSPATFTVSLLGFAGMHFLIGRLVVDYAERGAWPLAAYIVAMGLKFLVDDYGLNGDHKVLYERIGRWVLMLAVAGGFTTAVFVPLPEVVPVLIQAFLIGSVLFNVLKAELPASQSNRFGAFALGAGGYAVLLEML